MAWRNCKASLVLVGEINARWPGRDKASDGTIGDAAHATRNSDHNPWLNNTVRARDVDKDGIDAAWCVEHLRKLGAAGDPRLNPGGYLIFKSRIAGTYTKWAWHQYTGSNPHDKHFHVSFSTNPAGYDSISPWGIADSEVTDLDSRQDSMLTAIYQQMSGSPIAGEWKGWETWAGGTAEKLTVVDYLRRNNVEVRQLMLAVDTLRAELGALKGSGVAAAGSLSQADVNRIAVATAGLLGHKLANPS